MCSWRERATAVRAVIDRRKASEVATCAGPPDAEATLPEQRAFARRVIEEVLTPVMREFCRIVTGTPGTPVAHEFHQRAFGLTCELDSRRFSVNLFLLSGPKVRIAVSLLPSQTAGWHRDYPLNAGNEEIEEWFGTSLGRLYEAA